jgi:hypothetical protein
MLEELRKYLDNAKQIDGTEVEKLLGTRSNLEGFSKFWDMYGSELMLVAAWKLHSFETVATNFDKLEGYKQGLAEMGVFFEQSYKLNKYLEEQEKNRGIDKK